MQRETLKFGKENENPLFSIVTPVYNVEAYLDECINSVLEQSISDFELILVNDGSLDNSGAICDSYAQKDSRVKVIHKTNEGPTVARTLGVEIACGKYVIFLDSDDKIALDLLEHLTKILLEYKPDVILFNGIRFGSGSSEVYNTKMNQGIYGKESIGKIYSGLIYNDKDEIAIQYGICMKVFVREQYITYQCNVPKELYKGEDLAVCAPLIAQCNSVYVSEKCGYYYRDTPGSLMNSFNKEEVNQIKILAKYLDKAMGQFYESRIDTYVVTHLFDYLDRAMLSVECFRDYKKITQEMLDDALKIRLKRARCKSTRLNERVVFFLVKKRLFTLIWLLRKIKKRRL